MHGEISFSVSDSNRNVELQLFSNIKPTKYVRRGDKIAGDMIAPKNVWIYKLPYDGDEQLICNLEKIANLLYLEKARVKELHEQYELVRITLYVRSDYGQIGFSIPSRILLTIGELQCHFDVDIISGGEVENV